MTGTRSYDLARLAAGVRPYKLWWFSSLGSTNDRAIQLRRDRKLFAPAMILTGRQVAGRGRQSNTWWSGAGCITATFVEPIRDEMPAHQVPLVAGVAVRTALVRLTDDPVIQLKWPNDLMYAGRKLAGLLCERVAGVDLIGLGLNVNLELTEVPAHLRHRVTSLSRIAGGELDKSEVLIRAAELLHRMLSRTDEFPFTRVLREYDQGHVLRGRQVSVSGLPDEPAVTGLCQGLDSTGRLLVRDGSRRLVRIVAGHVQLR
jgi:BirA family biotin operon repressor/biotin-[acetyl-CoA-carboxylase] ligase